jgi:hypothetical protein
MHDGSLYEITENLNSNGPSPSLPLYALPSQSGAPTQQQQQSYQPYRLSTQDSYQQQRVAGAPHGASGSLGEGGKQTLVSKAPHHRPSGTKENVPLTDAVLMTVQIRLRSIVTRSTSLWVVSGPTTSNPVEILESPRRPQGHLRQHHRLSQYSSPRCAECPISSLVIRVTV